MDTIVELIKILIIPAGIAILASMVTSKLEIRQLKRERLSSLQIESIQALLLAADNFEKVFYQMNSNELEGNPPSDEEIKALSNAIDRIYNALLLFEVSADLESYNRVNKAFNVLVEDVLSVDTNDPNLEIEGTVDSFNAVKSLNNFIKITKIETRKIIHRQ